jgi:hypothetical protein
MKATIVEISSGSTFIDKEQRVTLLFADGDQCINRIRLPLSKLGLSGTGTGPFLDQEVEVTLSVPKVRK